MLVRWLKQLIFFYDPSFTTSYSESCFYHKVGIAEVNSQHSVNSLNNNKLSTLTIKMLSLKPKVLLVHKITELARHDLSFGIQFQITKTKKISIFLCFGPI